MKSFFKSLKKKSSNRDSAVPATPSSPFTSKVRLDTPEHSDASSPSSSSSSVSTIQVPVVRLHIARSSSQDTFNSSVDDVLAHGKAPSRASPAPIPDQRFLSPRHPYNDIQRVAMPPSPPPRSPLNGGHGPPRNRKHGPPNVLEAQMTSINATKASPARGGYYSPPRGQFTESLPQQKTRTIRFEASPSPIPHEAQLPQSRGRIPSDEHHLGASLQQLHKNPNSSSHTPEHANIGSPNARTLHPSRSSPHLPSSGRQNALESEDLSSLFPSPPPLIIRKRVPQPLVLQPRRPSAGSITPSSPDPSSSTESTPVSTPTSPGKQFSPPTQSPLSSKPYARHAKGIPPLLYDPPTSPLPSPPVNPQPKTPIPRFQGRVHLRGAQSTINLRSNENRGSPTHRMTSSDPVSEFLQQLGLEGHHSCSPLPQFESDQDTETAPHFSRTPRNAPVRWGYAL